MNWLVLCSKFKKGTVRASWEALPHPAQKGGPGQPAGAQASTGFQPWSPCSLPACPSVLGLEEEASSSNGGRHLQLESGHSGLQDSAS